MDRIFKKPYKVRRLRSRKDYDHEKMLGAAPLNLPKQLLSVTQLLVQTAENCTAYTAAAIRESMTGISYDPEAQWKAELSFMGVKDANGATLDTQLAVGVKVGFFPNMQGTGTGSSGQYKASAYFFVKKNGMDWFDACRNIMNQLYIKYGKVIPLSIGVNWFAEWDNTRNGIVPDSAVDLLGGHDTKIAGFENYNIDGVDYIVIQGSWGPNYGDNGLFRVSREVFNKHFEVYGAGYWVDDPNLQIQRLGFLQALYANVVALLMSLSLD